MDLTMDQKKGIAVIRHYLNVDDNPVWTDEYIMTKYDFVVEQIIENAKNIKNIKPVPGVTQMTQGGQSMSFNNGACDAWCISNDIKSMLPKPFIKLFY